MINRIKELFAAEPDATTLPRQDELHIASAALLVESAMLDGDFDTDERDTILRLLRERFGLTDEETETLVGEAEKAVDETGQLYGFTRVIKDRYEPEERIAMIEMLWEVAFADGNLDHFESNLIRRVAGLLFISDKDSGIAKQRVLVRLGNEGEGV